MCLQPGSCHTHLTRLLVVHVLGLASVQAGAVYNAQATFDLAILCVDGHRPRVGVQTRVANVCRLAGGRE